MFLAVFTDHYVTGGYWLHLAIVEIKASAAEDIVDFKITDMAMLADGTAGLEHAMVKRRPLPAKSSPLSSSAARICPLPPLCGMSNLFSSS